MIDVQEKLREMEAGIAILTAAGVEIPAEANELQEIMQRCVKAEEIVRFNRAARQRRVRSRDNRRAEGL